MLDDVLQQIENSNGQEDNAQKYWRELERLQALPPVMFFPCDFLLSALLGFLRLS